MLSKLYAGMQFKHREQIAAKYGANNSKDFTGWLRGLNFIRNVSAHHSRLWNINVLGTGQGYRKMIAIGSNLIMPVRFSISV